MLQPRNVLPRAHEHCPVGGCKALCEHTPFYMIACLDGRRQHLKATQCVAGLGYIICMTEVDLVGVDCCPVVITRPQHRMVSRELGK